MRTWRSRWRSAVEAAAEGLLAVTNANLGAAIRLSLFEKGLDPRDFVMIAFGGAAGLHAIAVADELGIRRVVFPESASTLSAYGILHSNLAHDLVRSKVLDAAPANLATLAGMADSMLQEAQARLDADAVPAAERRIELAADMRYKGQAFELTVPAPASTLDAAALDALIAGFHDIHRQRFSYANPGSPVEIVSLRVSAIGLLPKAEGKAAAGAQRAQAGPASQGVDGRRAGARSRRGAAGRSRPSLPLKGPAVIEEAYTTVLLADGWNCRRDRSGHLIAERVQP